MFFFTLLCERSTKRDMGHKAKLQNTRPLISISLIATIVIYLVLQSAPTNVNGVDGYSEIAPGHILYYLTIELDHAKRDSRLAAYGGVVLQRFEGLNL